MPQTRPERSAVTLRPATPADEPFLRALYASTREQEVAAWGWSPAQREAFLSLQFTAQQAGYANAYPEAEHHLILADAEPVGRIMVWRGPSHWQLVDISLVPAARGRGIGSELLARLQREAQSAGKRLRLQVSVANPAARRLYERAGFRRVGGDSVYDDMEWSAAEAAG